MKKNTLLLIAVSVLLTVQIVLGQEITPIQDNLPYSKNLNIEKKQTKENNIPVKSTSAVVPVNEQDSLALVEFYNNGGGENWGSYYSDHWLKGNVSSWWGVTVEDKRVTKLSISAKSGTFHSSIGNLSALTVLELTGFSGEIPQSIGDISTLEELYLYSYNITGNIPESIGNLKNLKYLILRNNKLTGNIPESIGNLSNLIKLELQNNKLTGEIPSSIGNLSSLEFLYLFTNDLSGQIPNSIGNLNSLERLYIFDNNLTGKIPSSIGNLSSLTDLSFSGNDLSGEIPSSIGNLSSLLFLYLQENNLSGEIPQSIGNLSSIAQLNLKNNNLSGTIPESVGNLKTLTMLSLRFNNLSGEIPQSIGNLTKIKSLFISENNLEGEVPASIENLIDLYDLYLNDNDFSAIPKIPVNLKQLYVGSNSFDFDDLEPLVREGLYISGGNQSPLILEKKGIDGAIELTMNCGGTKNTYQWYYNNSRTGLKDTSKTYIIPKDKDIQQLSCRAKNSLLRGITLVGIPPEETDCWQAGQLTFCVHSGKWEKAGSNKIKTTNTISVNDFLFFDGTMTIDTAKLGIDADGEFYVQNIPIPGGTTGKYTIASGKYSLVLIGNEKKITNFVNSNLKVTAKLFGTPLKITDLQFINNQDTTGIKVGCSVNIPKLSKSCGVFSLGTDIAINDLEITNKGTFFGGFEVENLGLLKKGYCIKKLTYDYDWRKDILRGGMCLSLPFIESELGGGLKFEKGEIDSIAWKIEYKPSDENKIKAFPIGLGTFGVKGFYGHFAGLKLPTNFGTPDKIDIKLGGIFSDVLSDKLYQITGDGRTIWPELFEISGSGKLLDPGDDLPFQLAGNTSLSYNASSKKVSIEFDGSFGTLNEETYLGTANGGFSVNFRSETEPPEFYGHFGGEINFPKLSNNWPFTWLSSFITFPIKLGTTNSIFNDNLNLVHGVMYFYPAKNTLYNIKYIIDISKTWKDDGYITFPATSRVAIGIEEKSGTKDGNITKTFTIPEKTDFAVFEINSPDNVAASILTTQSGKTYSESSTEDQIILSKSEDNKKAFWSILNPEAGDWLIELENPEQNDSIITYFQLKQNDFKFTVNQTENTVTVNWDIEQVKDGQTVNILLDDNNADFDGFTVASGNAKSGQISFSLDETTPDCSYYLFAQLIGDCSVVEAYADKVIDNPFTSLSPPLNFTSYYNSETGECEFNWDPGTEIEGYILTITDDQDNDSVYAVINGNQNYISLFIEDFETKSAEIKAYNQAWKIGCPSVLTKLTTGIEDDYKIMEEINKLKVYPNPTNGDLTIRYYVPEPSECEIRIFNIQGKEIARPLSGFQPAGYHQLNFQYENLPNGMYLIKYVNNNRAITVKSVFSK